MIFQGTSEIFDEWKKLLPYVWLFGIRVPPSLPKSNFEICLSNSCFFEQHSFVGQGEEREFSLPHYGILAFQIDFKRLYSVPGPRVR